MSIRNLDAIFNPKSVALIGASTRARSIGQRVAWNLLQSGLDVPIMPVNPKHASVAGVLAYPDIASLPLDPDLAVICTPPESVPGLVADLAKRRTRAAIVITAGFGEGGDERGHALKEAILAAAQPSVMRIVGPNCLGVLSTPAGLNASFAHLAPRKGRVAFVAQSGAMVTTVLDWATNRGIGFSHLVSLGDMADVDFGDMLDWLATDSETDAVLLYIEAVAHARKFMSAARAAARAKPVIAIKAGREAGAAKAAASHTGALAGIDAVYDTAFRRAGVLRVFDLDEVFDAVETLSTRPPVRSDTLAIVTNGGGVGVLAADALLSQGGRLAELSGETIASLNKVLPPTWSHGNPIDIIGDADGARYAAALKVLFEAPREDAVLVLNCPTAVASGVDAARAVVDIAKDANRAVLTSWLGAGAAQEARNLFSSVGISSYDTPEKAVRGFMHLVRYRRGQETLMEVPASIPADFQPDETRAKKIVAEALQHGEAWLAEQQVREILSCYGIPVVRSTLAATPEEAAARAQELGAAAALKIFSPDITHKSDVGGVALNLEGAEAVRTAAKAMQQRVRAAAPNARLEGFTVQEMIRRPNAFELIVGAAVDKTFGPFLLFGHGGTAVEVIGDKALALPPLNLALARGMMAETRIWRQLQGYRDRPAAALDAIALTLVKLSQLIADIDAIVDLDVNPLLADDHGVVALDARIRLAPDAIPNRLAISPYPKELEQRVTIDGRDFLIRPVRPEDARDFVTLFHKLTPDDVRMRFFSPLRTLSRPLLARLSQIDYSREMAFVLYDEAELVGVARFASDPDNEKAEFAITVSSERQQHGIGHFLLGHLIDFARRRGTGELFGDVLEENARMLAMAREFGFHVAVPSAGVTRVTLTLAK